MNAPATEIPPPLVFTDSAANKVKQLIDEEGTQAQAPRVRERRRLLRLPVRLHLRRGDERGRHRDGEERG